MEGIGTGGNPVQGSPGAEKEGHKSRILVVDDMFLHLTTTKLYLEIFGYEVFYATDGPAAWQLIQQEKPDLILLDVVLPGETGLELLSRIRSDYPAIAVVIMTAHGSEEVAAAALKLGAVDYIRKPVKYSSLSQIVNQVLVKQKQAEHHELAVETLRHAYEVLDVSADSILQCLSSGVVAVDNQLKIRLINQKARELTGLGQEKVIGRLYHQVFPFFFTEQLLEKTLARGSGFRLYEVKLPGDNGITVLSINTDVVFDYHRQKIGAVLIFDDVTELRRQQEAIRERDRLAIVGQMAAGMAHELKNPLTAIKGFAQIISEKSIDQGLSEYLQIMVGEIDRMNQVIQNFLQLARPNSLNFKKMSINNIIKEMVPMIEPQALMGDIQFDVIMDTTLPPVFIDPSQLKQVLLNLTQNALESMDNHGSLRVETKYIPTAQEVRLDVCDTGCGIPAERIKDLGMPFFTTKAAGTGLGLSITLSIIHRHQGRVGIQSQEGQGTTFSVFLPVAKEGQDCDRP